MRTASDEQLRSLLADFYAKRTLTHQPIDPQDCAAAILFLGGAAIPMHDRPFDPRGWRIDRSFSEVNAFF